MNQVALQKVVVAVLPFEDLTEKGDLNYFLQGLVDDLIVDLSRFNSLNVISQHTTSQLDIDRNYEQVKLLGIDYLIKGSFRSFNDKIRFNIQLINALDRGVVFAGKHEETFESLYELYDNIAQQIVSVIEQQININLLQVASKKPTSKLEVYDLWLKGMNEVKKGGIENDLKAREYFNLAIEKDPTYARAYTGLSLSHFNEWSCQLWSRWQVSQDGSHDYALKAVELDENDYIALTVLGRTYLYLGEYEKAEYCLEKAYQINPNDADNIALITTNLVFAGNLEQAEKLYLKAIALNPLNPADYIPVGTALYLEMGQYKKAIDLALALKYEAVWVDFPVYIGAAYYHLHDLENAEKCWHQYLERFESKINSNSKDVELDATSWVLEVNPFKKRSPLHSFIEYIGKRPVSKISNEQEEATGNSFISNKNVWEISYQNKKLIIPTIKGLNDIAKLVSNPESPISSMDLMGAQVNEKGIDVIDQRAKAEYQQRLITIQNQIEGAKEAFDNALLANLEDEYDSLLEYLSGAMGLNGKSRKAGSSNEKIRSAVTWRIRSAIKKINEGHPELARHLSNSIKTGTDCIYQPEEKVQWLIVD
ncbi:MAG: tetratricopeptide repeat protein [Fulvivirga sp.]